MRLVLASASPRRAELLTAAGFTFTVSAVAVDERARPDEAAADYVRRLASEKSARALDVLTAGSRVGLRQAGPEVNVDADGPAKAGPHMTGGPHLSGGPHVSSNADRVGTGFSWVSADHAGSGFSLVNTSGMGSGFSRIDDLRILGADTVVVVDDQILGKPRDDDDARDMLRRLSNRPHEVMTGVSLRSAEREVTGLETTRVWCERLAPEEIEWYVATGEGRDKAGAYAIQGRASRFIPRIDGSYSNVVGLPIVVVYRLLNSMKLANG